MPGPLDHPDDCGCQVCRQYRQRLADDPRAREVDASDAEVDRHAPDVEDWRDPDPPVEEDGGEPRHVVVEHRHVVEDKREPEPRHRRRNKDGKPGKRGPRGRRGKGRHGVLRTLAVGCVLVWVLQSFYPELDVPLVPGIACTAETTAVVDGDPVLWNPFSLGSKVKELAEDTVAGVVKKAALFAVTSALNLAGDTFRVMAAHAPRPEDIRRGLMDDAETVGRVTGFVIGGLTGKPVDELVPGMGAPVVDSGGCLPCSTAGGSTQVAAGGPWTPEQRANAEAIAAAGNAVGASSRDVAIALSAAIVESGLRNLSYGDRDSVGLFQQRDAWGSFAERTDPTTSARMFFTGGRGGQSGLLDLQDRASMSPGAAAQAVQRSAFPGRYAEHWGEALSLIGSDAEPVSASSSDPRVGDTGSVPTQPVALRAASFIRSEFGFGGAIGGSANSGHITNSLHYRGLALDVMTSGASGQRIYDYFAGPGYRPFGVDNVIFEHRIYNAGRGDHAYGLDDHMDHVHIDFHAGGGTGQAPAAATSTACVVPLGGRAAGGWRVGTFNILGAGHTPGRWRQRFLGVPALLGQTGVSVVGLQEVHPEQRPGVDGMRGWQTFGDWDAVTAWRTDTWQLEDRRYVRVPMYPGRSRLQPLVKLRHESGQAVWFLNVHNSRVPRLQIADERLEHAAVRGLSGPVVWLGDTNDRRFAPWAARSGFDMGGTRGIDQLAGGGGAALVGGTRVHTELVRRTSDHAFVYADLALAKSL